MLPNVKQKIEVVAGISVFVDRELINYILKLNLSPPKQALKILKVSPLNTPSLGVLVVLTLSFWGRFAEFRTPAFALQITHHDTVVNLAVLSMRLRLLGARSASRSHQISNFNGRFIEGRRHNKLFNIAVCYFSIACNCKLAVFAKVSVAK